MQFTGHLDCVCLEGDIYGSVAVPIPSQSVLGHLTAAVEALHGGDRGRMPHKPKI